MSEFTKMRSEKAEATLLTRLENSARQHRDQCVKLADAIALVKSRKSDGEVSTLEIDCSDELDAWDSAIVTRVALEGVAANSLAISEADAQNVDAAVIWETAKADEYQECLESQE